MKRPDMLEIRVTDESELFAALEESLPYDGAVSITLEKGEYRLSAPIAVKRDNLTLRGEGAVIYGSKRIDLSKYEIKNGVVEIPLAEEGISDLGNVGRGPFEDYWRVYDIPKPQLLSEGAGLEVFYGGEKMPICRYPKNGFVNIKEVCGKESDDATAETSGIAEGVFIPDDEIVKTWHSYKDILLIGYWCWDWAIQRHRIAALDFDTGKIKVDEPYHTFGYRPNKDGKGGRFYALNVKEALQNKGEWVIDREKGILTLIPYDGQTYIDVSVCEDAIFASGVKNLTVSGLCISECRGCGVRIVNSQNVGVSDICVKRVGAWGIVGEQCDKMRVEGCRVAFTGGGGIAIRGGDRNTLTSCEGEIIGNDITEVGGWHRSYMAGIEIDGVGVRVAENKIYNVPHTGIMFSGNNHIIEKNEIDNACYESHDAGAMYSGRNYTFRGNIIRYNYLHNLNGLNGMGCRGLYFDDAVSSAEVYGNLFANMVFAAIELGGGRDFKIHHNVFKNCRIALMYDGRACRWERLPPRLLQRLDEVDWQSPVWQKAYPELYTIRENDMFLPLGNEFTDNTVIGGDGVAMSEEYIKGVTKIENNLFIRDENPKPKKRSDWYHVD